MSRFSGSGGQVRRYGPTGYDGTEHMTPRVRKALVQAIGDVLAGLPEDVRRELRGRWKWRVKSLSAEGDVWGQTRGSLVTFDEGTIERLTSDGALLDALVVHEIGHAYRHLRGLTAATEAAEERATDHLTKSWHFCTIEDIRKRRRRAQLAYRRSQ